MSSPFVGCFLASLVFLGFAIGCGGMQRSASDPCQDALRAGPPPADLVCPEGTERQVTFSRRGSKRVPTARGVQESFAGTAKRVWCRDADGRDAGPFVSLDGRGRVVRSGQGSQGLATGPGWTAWDENGRPIAVMVRRTDSETERDNFRALDCTAR